MAPSQPRQLLVLSIVPIIALLSYFWYKKKKIGIGSDAGDTNKEKSIIREECSSKETTTPVKILQETSESPISEKSFSRSLSGVDSAPIDIILPKEHRAKVAPLISDEDLDLEIEKIKSMKNSMEPYKFKVSTTTTESPKKSPLKEKTIKPTTPKKQNNIANTTSSKKNSDKKNNMNGSIQEKDKSVDVKDASNKGSQNDGCVVEKKLCELKLENTKCHTKKSKKNQHHINKGSEQETELQRQSSERDSANHSPADVMLASPSLSSISDNHSEVNKQ